MSSESNERGLRSAFETLDARDDEHLGEYFYVTEAVGTLLKPLEANIAVGLKGVGKTATFRYLTEYESSKGIVVGINEYTHSLHLPRRDLHYSTCRTQFEIDLVMDALRAVDEHRTSLKGVCDRTLLDQAHNQFNSYQQLLEKYLGWFGGGSVLGCGFTLKKQNTPVVVGLTRTNTAQGADRLLKSLCDAGVKIRIVVDDPENVFSASTELDAHLVGGFLLAAIKLSRLSKNLKVIALLKTHVYSPVVRLVEDLPKYPDQWTRLSWSPASLKSLVMERLRWSKKIARTKSESVSLRQLFEVQSESQAEATLEDMISVVRTGPRDLLYWLSKSLEVAAKNGRERIAGPDVKKSLTDASLRSFQELEAAHHSLYPNIGELIRTVFKTRKSFSVPDFVKHLSDLRVRNSDMKNLSRMEWMQRQTASKLPFRLLEAGALGFDVQGQRILPYSSDYTAENLLQAEKVYLCPMLTAAIDRELSPAG